MKYMNKLKKEINVKGFKFILGISLIGFLFGVLFIVIISKTDKSLVKDYINNFITALEYGKLKYIDILKNSFINNFIFIMLIWILGMSVIGIPINLFCFFIKNFILGFTVSSFIYVYKLKGCIFSLFYIIPHNIINMFLYIIIVYYSLNFSITLIYSIIKKKNLNFKNLINKYVQILLFVFIGITITSLYESFILPNIMKKLLFLIKR